MTLTSFLNLQAQYSTKIQSTELSLFLSQLLLHSIKECDPSTNSPVTIYTHTHVRVTIALQSVIVHTSVQVTHPWACIVARACGCHTSVSAVCHFKYNACTRQSWYIQEAYRLIPNCALIQAYEHKTKTYQHLYQQGAR